MSSKKLPVAINIFPSLDYVELVQFDDKSAEIDKAASLPCQFDPATRQMVDREVTLQTIRDLYNSNRLPFNTPAVLVLPSFFTREIELPTEFTKDELRYALVNEAERFYIFKKAEPQIDWINLDESRLLYSAFPKTEIEKYQKIFQELRIPLFAIELNYFSILRGLVATGAVSEELETNSRWCLLVVSDNSFFASIQEGIKIIKTTDAPLSTAEGDDHSAINEIQQDFESFSDMEVFNKLIVINNANSIGSDLLLGKLAYAGNLILIEQNALTLRSRGAMDGQFPCSLESIGGVFYQQLPELPKMNLLLETSEDVVGIMYYRKEAAKWVWIANAAVFFLCLLMWAVISWILVPLKDHEREDIQKNINAGGSSISAERINEVNRKKFIKKVVDENVKLNNFLVKVGSSTPEEVWLDKIDLDDSKLDTPPTVSIAGKTLNLDKATSYSNSLSGVMPGVDLEVSNPQPATTADGQSYFTWTIQNKGAAPAGAAPGAAPGAPPGRG